MDNLDTLKPEENFAGTQEPEANTENPQEPEENHEETQEPERTSEETQKQPKEPREKPSLKSEIAGEEVVKLMKPMEERVIKIIESL